MDELLNYLHKIQDLLNQISTITDNQTTILLNPIDKTEQETKSLDMLEEMADYKDEYTKELIACEELFQNLYNQEKDTIKDSKDIVKLKEMVTRILEIKQEIVEHEQSNLLLLQSHSKKKAERLHIPQSAKEVAKAYKKHQIKN